MEVPRGRQVPVPALSQLVYPLALALTAVLIVLVVVGTRTPVLDALAYQQARQSAEAALGGAQEAVDRDERLGVDSEELAPLKTQLAGVAAHQRSAKTTRDERAVAGEASAVGGRADALGNRYRADLSAIHQSAAQFIAGGKSTEAMRAEAQATLGSARDRAVLATWLNENGVGLPYRALEQFAQALSSADRAQVAEAAAGVAFYADRLHKQLLAGMPDKAIVISIHAQQLTAYEGGKPVIDTPITSGRLPELPTDIGPMAVLRKDSPWTMHSPWPKGSPLWYPDTVVQYATFFTNSGESIHDASWEPDSLLGPGSQYNASTRSHGCVHVPFNDAAWMYNFAEVGMPVIVYPGDGKTVADQLSQITTNDQGVPNNPA